MSRLVFETDDDSFFSIVEPNYIDYPELEEDTTVAIVEAFDSEQNDSPFYVELDEIETKQMISYLQNQLEEFYRFKFSRE